MLHVYSWIEMTLETKQPALESLLVVLQFGKLFPQESHKNQAKKWERRAGCTPKLSAPFQERVGNPSIYVFLIMAQIFDGLTSGWPLRALWWNRGSVLGFLFCSLKGHHLLSRRKEGTSEGPFYKPPTTMYTHMQQCSGWQEESSYICFPWITPPSQLWWFCLGTFWRAKHRVWRWNLTRTVALAEIWAHILHVMRLGLLIQKNKIKKIKKSMNKGTFF